MLYDVHAHVGLDLGFYLRGWWPYAATAQDMLQHLESNGIGHGVVFPFGLPSAFDPCDFSRSGKITLLHDRTPFDVENQHLADELDRIDTHRRLSMLAMFDPTRRIEEQMYQLELLKGRYVGLKLQATIIESPVHALLKEGRPILEFADAHALPVLIHTSIIPSDRYSQVVDCLRVAEAFPRVRFNLAHSLRFDAAGLRRAAQLPNVWVDCSAHLAHCDLARANSPVVAPAGSRVDADYTRPAQVLEAIHDLLGGASKHKYMWGSDNPFMSWCDDTIRSIFSYRQEAEVLHALPAAVRESMGTRGPEAWLLGKT